MAVDIGPKIGIEGEREFRQKIAQTNQALKTLAAEGKAVTSAFNSEADAEKKSAAQMDLLNRQIETQKDKIALLEKGLMESAKMYGEADVRTMKWQQALHEATADLNKMENELHGMDGTVEKTSDAMEDAGKATKSWADVMKGSLLADAVKAGLKEMVQLAAKAASAFWDASKAGAAYADDMLTLSTVTGLSTEQLQKYAYAADFVDTSLDTITGSLTKLTSSMNKARNGEGDAAEVFAELGIAVTDANGQLRSANDVFNEALDALGGITNATERDAKAMTLFGKSAKELNPLIAAGSTQLSKLGKEAEKSGYVLSGSALKALNAQQDAMDRLDKKAEALKNNFAAKMAPSMTRAYDTIAKTLDNPRVQRGLDLMANGLGRLIESGSELAERVLPKMMELLGVGDVRLKTFTDAELELAAAIDESRAAYDDAMRSYTDSATAIMQSTDRTRDLWKELQTLADESGHVQDADRERANFILSQLNEALGTEYSMNNGIIGQYREMQTEIDKLIAKREAEALIAAGAGTFAEQAAQREEALQRAGAAAEALAKAQSDLAETQAKLEDARERTMHAAPADLQKIALESRKLYEEEKDLQKKIKELQTEYDTASSTAQSLYANVDRWERAQAAAASDNYNEAVRLLTDEFGVTLEYYAKKRVLSEQDRKDLQEKLKAQEQTVAEYKRNLDKGLTGFSAKGLQELQDYVDVAKKILNGEYVASSWIDGLEKGLSDTSRMRALEAAAKVAPSNIMRTTKAILGIASPAKQAAWIGQMWDEGLIKGMEESQALVEKTASGLADAMTAASTQDGADISFGNDLTTAGSGGWSTSSNSYTTNLGGITVRIDGAGEVNEDVLAQRVAIRLSDELRRAQRGGRY